MIYYIYNVLFSILNILLGWIPFGRLPSLPKELNDEIKTIGELNDSPYGGYYKINSADKNADGKCVISKGLWNASRMCGGAFCDPISKLVILDQGLFSKNESTLVEALIAHEFGHCFYQGHGEFYWNSCWCYAIREIQADYFAWKQNPSFAKEILHYINKYIPKKSWKDAYLWASMYLFRIIALRILTMIK